MEYLLNEFLKSEKSLYLFTGIIGTLSIVVGILFISYSNHKSFAVSMIVLGILELAIMLPNYTKYQLKTDAKTTQLEINEAEFRTNEHNESQQALQSFFWLKIVYGSILLFLAIRISFISPLSLFYGISIALILHLALAITIDNFGERYTKQYAVGIEKLTQ